MADDVAYFNGETEDFRLFSVFFAISFACHISIFVILTFLPDQFVNKKQFPSIINVDLASLPVAQPSPPEADGDQVKAESVKPAEAEKAKVIEPKQVKKDIVPKPSTPKPKPVVGKKTSMKKKTYHAKKVLESARDQLKKEVAAAKEDRLDQRLKELQKEIGQNRGRAAAKQPSGRTGSGPSTGIGGGRLLSLEDTYRNIIAFEINKNWNFSEQLAGGGKGLLTAIVFKIMPNGEIKDIWFEKRSGNRLLDDSAYKAIVKSSPVQPHPSGLNKPYVQGALEFTPAGIK